MAESVQHEQLVGLFRDRKELAAELLALVGVELEGEPQPEPDEADLGQAKPVLARADLIQLYRKAESIRMGLIVEIQLSEDGDKRFRWPLYATTLRDRHRCPVVLVVVAPEPRVADWARTPIELGPDNAFRVVVLGPTEIPRPTSPEEPHERLLLALRAHPDLKAATIAVNAANRLEGSDRVEYIDTLLSLLSEEVRKEIIDMVTTRSQLYPASDFAKEHYGKGQSELLLRLLTRRFGELPSEIRERIETGRSEDLLLWGDRLLDAPTLADVFKD